MSPVATPLEGESAEMRKPRWRPSPPLPIPCASRSALAAPTTNVPGRNTSRVKLVTKSSTSDGRVRIDRDSHGDYSSQISQLRTMLEEVRLVNEHAICSTVAADYDCDEAIQRYDVKFRHMGQLEEYYSSRYG